LFSLAVLLEIHERNHFGGGGGRGRLMPNRKEE